VLKENEDLLEEYFTFRVLEEGTKGVYRNAIGSWDRYTGVPLTQLNQASLSTWYKKASKELHPTTIEKYAALTRILFAYTLEGTGLSKRRAKADAQDLFDIIPFKDLRKRAKQNSNLRDKLVTTTEFRKIIKAANSQRMKALLSITYESGCRKGEIFSLRLKDIQVYDQYWTLSVEGKTGTRTVPIIHAIPYLKAWLQIHPDRENENSALFVTTNKGGLKPMSPLSFNTGLRLLCKNVGIRMLYPHQLRHTRLTELAEDGVGEYQLKSFAGWTPSSSMANKYVHLSGKGHVNAVLEAGGVEVEKSTRETIPMLEMVHCPNCDKQIDSEMILCPYCNFILDQKLGINHQNEIQAMRAELEAMKAAIRVIREIDEELEDIDNYE